jgi:hypothetical protein
VADFETLSSCAGPTDQKEAGDPTRTVTGAASAE